jgi:aspartate racemase
MRIAGIVGGIGPESTVEYYRLAIALCRERAPGGSAPPILINSIDLDRMLGMIGENRLLEVTNYLLGEIERLARAGADFGALAANTPHVVFGALEERTPIPLVSLVDAACRAVVAQRLRRVGLFGTRFTMQAAFYPEALARSGIAAVLPSPEEQDFIHGIYIGELVKGVFRPETRARLHAIAGRLRDDEGADGVILAGTELPLILRDEAEAGLPLIDTTRAHVLEIVANICS